MDLAVAIFQWPTIDDVSPHTTDAGTGQRADGKQTSGLSVQERAAILSQQGAELCRNRVVVRLLGHRETSLPSLEAVDVSRIDGSTRMATTWFAAVFDIDAQNHPFGTFVTVTVIVRAFQYSDAGPDKSIGRSRARLRTADLMVIRVAELELLAWAY